ncbi:2,3,4,5-tetrahydropyridine-2,6-carboxylate N-succinyltransferase [Rhodobacter xanthinilyticus]|uniref:2,3,4,5-tetrahydropyridine-2,6-carboxylate N-succinyltransferase n=1 Tax=Rhodobacter xanthinilyticus TaxID=1850250 RepID=A0A1D9MEL5_9RHOB|nr:Hint domain-containing protein [Rhodobacter xanthinilyticus]AOZ70311.1 2,3,4,5-tetrahydropyridine-2,6-carboxylate N-succinyltransferase [Rhodobacter xanthinilyticus]
MPWASELSYNTSASALQMANTIFGDGVTVVGASYTGDARSSAIYSRGDALSPEATPSNTGVILSTGYATSFTNSFGDVNTSTNTSTNTSGVNNNADFNAIAGTTTYDAAWLDVDFIPTGDTMTVSFTFASEEYPEYINSIYNDIVGVWVNGSYVELAAGNGNTSVINVNSQNNENLYISNTSDSYNTEMDGFTVTMSLTFPVNVGVVNSIRIGIADTSDSNYDSNILIAGDSIQTVLIAADDVANVAPGEARTIDVLANDHSGTNGTLTITHINGVAVTAGQTVTLASGEQVTLNPDGTLTVLTDAEEETVNFTYEISDGAGHTDVGFVTVNVVPCFTAGTRIATPEGPRAVEDLRPGDLVFTQDDGAQPLRWVGRHRVRATGDFAPIRIEADTFGRHDVLTVSPQHRILMRDALAELMFGEAEVLVAAKHLVDGARVRVVEGGEVEYFHLLFDRHQVIFSEGLATESFLPGPQVLGGLEAACQAEICALFPELDPATGTGFAPAARRMLKGYEARLLRERAA